MALTDNLANILIVRKVCVDLVAMHAWTWNQALERAIPDHVATRIIDLKNVITMNESENIKFQTVFAFFVRQECNVDKPSRSQLLCTHKMKLFYLQDNDQLEPQKFF